MSHLVIGHSGTAADVGDAAFQACRASLSPQVPQFFWETDPFLKAVFGKRDSTNGSLTSAISGLKRPQPPIEIYDSGAEGPLEKSLKVGAVLDQPLHKRALKAVSSEDLQNRRTVVLGEWASMVALNINAFSVGKMLEADKKAVVYQDVVCLLCSQGNKHFGEENVRHEFVLQVVSCKCLRDFSTQRESHVSLLECCA